MLLKRENLFAEAVMCSSSQVYDSFSLRADSLMGEFKVGQFNCIKILLRFKIS